MHVYMHVKLSLKPFWCHSEIGGHGHDFGQDTFVASDTDSDRGVDIESDTNTRFFGTSDCVTIGH